MHVSGKRLGFSSVTRISEVGERERNSPDILAVDVDLRWRIYARICDFERQKRSERFRFNRKLENRVLLSSSIKPDRFGRQSGSNRSKVFDIFRRRVQRGNY